MLQGTLIAERYRIERLIARGGMSRVYEAVDTKFGALVAVKLASPPDEDYEEFLARFKREARIGRLLGRTSSRMVRALDWGEYEEDSLYLVMDLVESAKQLDLRSGSRKERVGRVIQATALVAQVHLQGIVHRDIKPANFLIDTLGKLHLADFGLAKIVGETEVEHPIGGMITQSGLALGTPYFMAPEQVDAKNVDRRADVYALGVMLFQALTGQLPFQGNIAEVISAQQAVLSGVRPMPRPNQIDASVPARLNDICMRAMEVDVDVRLRDGEALLKELTKNRRPSSGRQPKQSGRLTGRPVGDRRGGDRRGGERRAGRAPKRGRTKKHSGRQAPVQEAPSGASEGRTAARTRRPLPRGLRRAEGKKNEVINEKDGSVLIQIPSGLLQPHPAGDASLPPTRMDGFFLGKYPVTWGQYLRFCIDTSREPPDYRHSVSQGHPVHNISFHDAWDYCAWANLRLASAREWEYAARGGEPRDYPWGNEPPTDELCNWAGHSKYGKEGFTSPVGNFPAGASPFGCVDMVGNVLEWVRQEDDPAPRDGPPLDRPLRVLRGGAYHLSADLCQVQSSMSLAPDKREGHVGFRVACSLFHRPDSEVLRRPKVQLAISAPLTSVFERVEEDEEELAPRDKPQVVVTPNRRREMLREVYQLLPQLADNVARKANEIKFVYGRTEGAQVGLSFTIEDERALWGILEQRVTLDQDALKGSPTGRLNLLRAVNAVNRRVRGLRCLVSTDRLRFRRPVFLAGRSLRREDLQKHISRLLSSWGGLFQDLRLVQRGADWNDCLRFPPRMPSQAEGVLILEELLEEGSRDIALERLDDNQLGIGFGKAQIVLSCVDEQVFAETVVNPWKAPQEQIAALRSGDHAPEIEMLLKELNAKNHERFHHLAWDPKRGVVAHLLLGEGQQPAVQRLFTFLDAAEAARTEPIETLIDREAISRELSDEIDDFMDMG